MGRPKIRTEEYRRKYRREWQRARYRKDPTKARLSAITRHRAIRAFFLSLANDQCAVCGFNRNPAILQFDHIAPVMRNSKNKVGGFINVAAAKGYTEEVMAEFFSNIQVLCPNCHAEKTLRQLVKYE